MSCKETATSKSKHYTSLEKKVFLQVLTDYKHVIELKKNNSTTVKEKDVAWTEVCQKYNESTLISQQRTMQQLKKLWANLKHSQRDALTKERQSCMSTGGGPGETEVNVDPDIVNIAPNLMKTAPVLFTSNMTEEQINDKHELVFDVISNDDVEMLNIEKECINNGKNDVAIVISEDICTSVEGRNEESMASSNTNILGVQQTNILTSEKFQNTHIKKRKRKMLEFSDTEDKLRIERLKHIIEQEQQLANIKQRHEEKVATMKEAHLREMNDMQKQHLNKIHSVEMQISNAKLRVIERQLDKENIDPYI